MQQSSERDCFTRCTLRCTKGYIPIIDIICGPFKTQNLNSYTVKVHFFLQYLPDRLELSPPTPLHFLACRLFYRRKFSPPGARTVSLPYHQTLPTPVLDHFAPRNKTVGGLGLGQLRVWGGGGWVGCVWGEGGGGAAIQPGNNPAEVSPWSFSKKHNLQKRKQTFFYIFTTNFFVMHRGLCSVHCIIILNVPQLTQ